MKEDGGVTGVQLPASDHASTLALSALQEALNFKPQNLKFKRINLSTRNHLEFPTPNPCT